MKLLDRQLVDKFKYLAKIGLLFWLIVLGKSCETLKDLQGDLDSSDTDSILLLISIDGLPAYYLDRNLTPTLDSLAAIGVAAEALTPVFPSKTFPNHYTQVTGLYPVNHGIVSNRMYDQDRDRYFTIGSGSSSVQDGSWYQGEPIWVTASKQGLVSATMFWPGSAAEINGTRPDYYFAYNGSVPEADRIRQVLEWMALTDKRPNLITLYFERVDQAGHQYGPESTAVGEAIRLIDQQLNDLMMGIKVLQLEDKVDIILVSDHGMSAMGRDRMIFLDDYISLEDTEVLNWSPVLELLPEQGQELEIFHQLSGAHPKLRVYHKSEFPPNWHLIDHPRVAPVVAIAAPGWSVSSRAYFEDHPETYQGGNHGYDHLNPEMQGIFLASGPGFLSGSRLPPVSSVHLYQLMCHLLNLTPADNDGDLAVWREILTD